ncbi:IE1 [Hemileuca sp. nucleopolyhedrovirus]|uniref:IE1 n=1 Tax=Hemileuca sp. nucleopolyhedrovirus TaxID=1367203 RepID=S5N945_9ABAC|nr:IE1 [Hemileuca sp. nucleopolyhedrovirus]AGR56767.1 IE1 [Hemileuca sp. nucleopolyhedrovirus]
MMSTQNAMYKNYIDNNMTPTRDLFDALFDDNLNLQVDSVENKDYTAQDFQDLVKFSEEVNESYDKQKTTYGCGKVIMPDGKHYQNEIVMKNLPVTQKKYTEQEDEDLNNHVLFHQSTSSSVKVIENVGTIVENANSDDDDDSGNSDDNDSDSIISSENDDDKQTNNKKRKLNETDHTKPHVNMLVNKVVDHNKKTRGRYKKRKLEHTKDPEPGSMLNATNYEKFNKHVTLSKSDMKQLKDYVNNDRQFASHITDTGYYMFIVCESNVPEQRYRIFYVNYVNSISMEYSNKYYNIDRLVMIVSFDRFRFMISYNLLKQMNIPIPSIEDFCKDQIDKSSKCAFNEVKDFEFLSLLINTFHLDVTYARAKIIMVLSSMGQMKSSLILKTLNEMDADKSLYTLPLNLHRRETATSSSAMMASTLASTTAAMGECDISPYVESVIKYSQGLRFSSCNENKSDGNIQEVLDALKFWLRDKNEKSGSAKDKDNFLSYKYGSVARLLYDSRDVKRLVQIKKDKIGDSKLIELYLSVSGLSENSNNFILVSTKTDERITIVKYNTNYIWITSVIKDIIPHDIIGTFKKYTHHVFNLNKSNRKEINNKHNGMIKLVSFYTSQKLPLQQLIVIAENYFECKYTYVNF